MNGLMNSIGGIKTASSAITIVIVKIANKKDKTGIK